MSRRLLSLAAVLVGLDCGPALAQNCTPQNLPNVSAPGAVVQGALSATDCSALPHRGTVSDRYTFSANVGDRLVITMTAGTLIDPYLFLLNPAGAAIASNDDSGGTLNSRVEYTAVTGGMFTVIAASFQAGDYGTYTLTVSRSGVGVPAAPTGLRTTINNRDATLSWDPTQGALNYILQAGNVSGQYTLFDAPVGNTTSVVGRNLPIGLYYWRLIASNTSGNGPPSAETSFVIGGVTPNCLAPAAPQNFTFSVVGSLVTLVWAAATSGGTPTTYVVEAGSSTGLANLYNAPTGSAATTLAVAAPNGTYFVRIRAQNACGLSGPSNEQRIVVPAPPIGPTVQCTYSVSPTSQTISGSGGTLTLTISTSNQCQWQASTPDGWLRSTSPLSGSGSATVQFSVDRNSSSQRTGRVTVLGTSVSPSFVHVTSVSQDADGVIPPACSYSVSPQGETINASGGVLTISVSTGSQCQWQASTPDGWLRPTSPLSGSGSATVQFSVDRNTSSAREGRVTVLGTSVSPSFTHVTTVSQGTERIEPPPCTYTLSPPSQSISPGGGSSFAVQVATPLSTCTWRASTSAPWMTITSGQTGTGNGTVRFDADANFNGQRSGSVTVVGTSVTPASTQSATISQAADTTCNYGFSPTSLPSAPASGGRFSLNVLATSECAWVAETNQPWISVFHVALAAGNGPIEYGLGSNTGPARSGTITVQGPGGAQQFAITQAAGSEPKTARFTVANSAGVETTECSANRSGPWTCTFDAGLSGPIDEIVGYDWLIGGVSASGRSIPPPFSTAEALTPTARNVALTVRYRDGTQLPAQSRLVTFQVVVPVSTSAGCQFTLSPQSQSVPAAGGTFEFFVNSFNCSQTWYPRVFAPASSFIALISPSSGQGNGIVRFRVAPNTGSARSDRIRVFLGTRVFDFQVNQSGQ